MKKMLIPILLFFSLGGFACTPHNEEELTTKERLEQQYRFEDKYLDVNGD